MISKGQEATLIWLYLSDNTALRPSRSAHICSKMGQKLQDCGFPFISSASRAPSPTSPSPSPMMPIKYHRFVHPGKKKTDMGNYSSGWWAAKICKSEGSSNSLSPVGIFLLLHCLQNHGLRVKLTEKVISCLKLYGLSYHSGSRVIFFLQSVCHVFIHLEAGYTCCCDENSYVKELTKQIRSFYTWVE